MHKVVAFVRQIWYYVVKGTRLGGDRMVERIAYGGMQLNSFSLKELKNIVMFWLVSYLEF